MRKTEFSFIVIVNKLLSKIEKLKYFGKEQIKVKYATRTTSAS